MGGGCCESLLLNTHLIRFYYSCLLISRKVIYGIFLLVTHIRFRRKALHRMVLSFFSSSIMGIFQKTPRSCSLIGSLIFQNPSSPRILGWMATYKPLTIFLKASCIYFPVRGQTELCFSSKSYLIFTCHSNPTPTRYKRGHGRPK